MMLRNFAAAIGVSLLALLGMSALGVVGASATTSGHFTSDAPSGTTVLDIAEPTGTAHKLTFFKFGAETECHHSTYSAHLVGATSQVIKAVPTFTSCTLSSGESGATAHTNGCWYTFTSRTTGHATLHFQCPIGKIATYTTPTCETKYPPQTISGVTYDTIEANNKHALTVNITTHSLTSENHGLCSIGGTHRSNSGITGALTIVGRDSVTSAFVNLTHT